MMLSQAHACDLQISQQHPPRASTASGSQNFQHRDKHSTTTRRIQSRRITIVPSCGLSILIALSALYSYALLCSRFSSKKLITMESEGPSGGLDAPSLFPSLSWLIVPPYRWDSHKRAHQRPWVGPGALSAPIWINSTTTHYHVRVVIRIHHEHRQLARGLIHSLRHQQRLLASASSSTLSMDFALVPTEPGGILVADAIAQEFWLDAFDPFPHVYAVHLNEAFFSTARTRALPLKCTPAEIEEFQKWSDPLHWRKVCVYENHMYYQATDVALEELVEGCTWCTHVVVTNDDNNYHPDYFRETLLDLPSPQMASPETHSEGDDRKVEQRGWDLVTTGFTTGGRTVEPAWTLGSVDLGSVLVSKKIVTKLRGFIAVLPINARAVDAHHADFLFMQRALDGGALARVVNKLLFFHN